MRLEYFQMIDEISAFDREGETLKARALVPAQSPIFVIGTHVYLADVGEAEGPTAFVPGSHTSGMIPPHERREALELSYRRRRSVSHLARAGDVTFFVSDVWHRARPAARRCTSTYPVQFASRVPVQLSMT